MWLLKDKRPVLLLGLLLLSYLISGQQFTQFSNYLLNSSGLNPAYVGSKDKVNIMASYRKQWIKLPGSPYTMLLSGDGYFEDKKIGIGGVLLQDNIGNTKATHCTVNGSYRIEMKDYKLQFGLSTGFSSYKEVLNDLEVVDQGDKVFSGGKEVNILPMVGLGAYLFKNDFYFGVSSPDLLESEIVNKRRHFYTSVGKVFELNKQLKIKPSLLAKYVQSSPLQLDVSTTLFFQDQFGVGASYRTGAGFVLFTQFLPTPNLAFALAYDKMTNGLRNAELGTFEITALYSLATHRSTIYSPRYF